MKKSLIQLEFIRVEIVLKYAERFLNFSLSCVFARQVFLLFKFLCRIRRIPERVKFSRNSHLQIAALETTDFQKCVLKNDRMKPERLH